MNERDQRTWALIAYAIIGSIMMLVVYKFVTLVLTLD